MTKTAFTGPLVVYGDRNPPGTAATGSSNADKGPSLFWGGTGILDPRVGYNMSRYGALGWGAGADIPVIDQVPSAIADNNIAASQTPGSSVSGLTLGSSAAAGITLVASGGATYWASGTLIPANTLIIDLAPTLVTYGLASVASGLTTISLYSPTTAISRAVRITSGGNDTGITFTVAGYDIYGYAMTEAITGASGGVATGKKAFKFISSVTPSAAVATTVKVGTADIVGFPLRVDSFGYQYTTWIASGGGVASATAQTTPFGTASAFTYADTTSPATTTTGDVRGTLNLGTAQASDASKRLQVILTVPIANIGTTTGLVGVTQV